MRLLKRLSVLCAVAGFCSSASAQYFSQDYQFAREYYGLRWYYLYPYKYSIGTRVDPYWSYASSYFPYPYHGDGSYYGLGYSGYRGDGWYGNYWYW